ncbi:MAG: hypothetical protein K1X44_05065 [Alphaproteobacteria bacterium]|nr:hypothetical protein [Alphaproteobacteria bacterium]
MTKLNQGNKNTKPALLNNDYLEANSTPSKELKSDHNSWHFSPEFLTVTTGTEGDDTIVGVKTDENEIYGLGGNDRITGGDKDDAIDAGNGNDSIIGGGGDDQVFGGGGTDFINGGDGFDAAFFSGDFADYGLRNRGAGTWRIEDFAVGRDGIDRTWGVEAFVFNDGVFFDESAYSGEGLFLTNDKLKEVMATFGREDVSLSEVRDYLKTHGDVAVTLTSSEWS